MTITLKTGDIFETKMQTIVIPVNCVGVMGRGLALEAKRRWPRYFAMYSRACGAGVLHIGYPGISVIEDKWIISFPTKHHWRDKTKIVWILHGVEKLATLLDTFNIKSLAVPALGCGEGGLDWADVKPLLVSHFEQYDIPVELYGPKEE